MFECSKKLLASGATGLLTLMLTCAPAQAEPVRSSMTAIGATSTQQIRIAVSVAPTFKPQFFAAAAGPSSNGSLCFASNVDPEAFDVLVEGSWAREIGPSNRVTQSNHSSRRGETCIALRSLEGSDTAAPSYRSVIISPR